MDFFLKIIRHFLKTKDKHKVLDDKNWNDGVKKTFPAKSIFGLDGDIIFFQSNEKNNP